MIDFSIEKWPFILKFEVPPTQDGLGRRPAVVVRVRFMLFVLRCCAVFLLVYADNAEPGGSGAPSVRVRRGIDSTLHVSQIGLGYCLMLVAMTYHIPLFIAVLIGLGLGHCAFAHREEELGATGGRPEPCCPDTSPILSVGTSAPKKQQQQQQQQQAGGGLSNAGSINSSLESGLLDNQHPAGASSADSHTALDLFAHVRLQVREHFALKLMDFIF